MYVSIRWLRHIWQILLLNRWDVQVNHIKVTAKSTKKTINIHATLHNSAEGKEFYKITEGTATYYDMFGEKNRIEIPQYKISILPCIQNPLGIIIYTDDKILTPILSPEYKIEAVEPCDKLWFSRLFCKLWSNFQTSRNPIRRGFSLEKARNMHMY